MVMIAGQLFAGASYGQTAADPSAAAERIQREQQERQQQQLEQQRRQLPPPKPSLEPTEAAVNADQGGTCRAIREIVIESAPHLGRIERAHIIKAYVGRCLTVRDIEQLMADVTNSYVRRGYVTTRVYLPQQDLSAGRLTLTVVEGAIEKISLQGKGSGRTSLRTAMPDAEIEPLNLRDLEQGLDQINRLQSNRATLDIEPGSAAGTSRVVIHNDADLPLHASATIDNMGQHATGKNQVGISGAYDSPLGLNDYVNLAYRRSLPLTASDRQSWLGSFLYLVPYGYTTTSFAYSYSNYDSVLHTASGLALHNEGNSTLASVRFEDVLLRSRSNRLTFSTSLTAKNTRNYLADQLLTVSSRKLTVADAGLEFTSSLLGGVATIGGGYSWGLTGLDALADQDDLLPDAPHAQFRRINYNLTYARPFRLGAWDASFSSSVVGQHADNALYGSEQILVGGIYSVRGFDETSLSGDHGLIWRNELSVRQPFHLSASIHGLLRPFIAVDYGRTRMREPDTGVPEGTLVGGAVGIDVINGPFALQLFNSRPIHVPGFMTREANQTWIRVSVSM